MTLQELELNDFVGQGLTLSIYHISVISYKSLVMKKIAILCYLDLYTIIN